MELVAITFSRRITHLRGIIASGIGAKLCKTKSASHKENSHAR